MSFNDGYPTPEECVDIAASEVVLGGFIVDGTIVEPDSTRYALVEIMMHERPASRGPEFYKLMGYYIDHVSDLATLATVRASARLSKEGLGMWPYELTRQVGGLVCGHEAVQVSRSINAWADYIFEEYVPMDHNKLDGISSYTDHVLYRPTFERIVEEAGGQEVQDHNDYFSHMTRAIPYTILGFMKRYEEILQRRESD